LSKAHRSELEICLDLMKMLRTGSLLPTPLMYKTNLSWELMQRFVLKLIGAGLVGKSTVAGVFYLTNRGADCLGKLESGMAMLEPVVEKPSWVYQP
jgi:predicted transcriptional regulator